MPTFEIERSYNSRVIGLDEVGRGPIAGPVVSCACFYKNYTTQLEKKLSIENTIIRYLTVKYDKLDLKKEYFKETK